MPKTRPTTVSAAAPKFDTVGFIMAFEAGMLDEEEVIDGFQYLIDTGLAWQLQGSYGRTAMDLVRAGYCTLNTETC